MDVHDIKKILNNFRCIRAYLRTGDISNEANIDTENNIFIIYKKLKPLTQKIKVIYQKKAN